MAKDQAPNQVNLYAQQVREALAQAVQARRLIDAAGDLGAVPAESLEELDFKEHQCRQADLVLAGARLLFDLRSASAFVPDIWPEWATLCSLIHSPAELQDYARSRPWWEEFDTVRKRERFFHWELEFPEVFINSDNPGFDAVIGNPPWDKVKVEKKDFFGKYDVLIRDLVGKGLEHRISEISILRPESVRKFNEIVKRTRIYGQVLKFGGDYIFNDWVVDGHIHSGREQDLFKFFVERSYQLLKQNGIAGIIVPGGIYYNDGTTGLRHLLIENSKVLRFYVFENRQFNGTKVFPIHPNFKFVNLVFQKCLNQDEGFKAAFLRRDLSELKLANQQSWVVTISSDEIKKHSPYTFGFPEYKGPRDREISHKIYENALSVGDFLKIYKVSIAQELNISGANDLWTDRETRKTFNPKMILREVPTSFIEIQEKMAEHGFWPLFQDAHIHHHVIAFKKVFGWVSLEKWVKVRGVIPNYGPRVVFRHTCRNVEQRTCFASLIPQKTFIADTLHGFEGPENVIRALSSLMNSITFDYIIRLRVCGQNMRHFQMAEMPFPTLEKLLKIPIINTIVANESKDFIFSHRENWERLVDIEFAVCRIYELCPEDFEYILSTFPIFSCKWPLFVAYLNDRLRKWKNEFPE
jgi:hypothetical protein